MCGIAGIYRFGRESVPVDRRNLERMSDSMYRRGPDGSGLWVSPDMHVGLAHRRLSIIDLSESAGQPMADPDGRALIVFNGEIYNFLAIRRDLELQGIQLRTRSDTEVLLQLYLLDGERFVHRLRGMFAIAIWDVANRQLLLARDPFGIKPLYYSEKNGGLTFASQVKALLASGCGRKRSSAGMVGFWVWGHVPEPFTTYEDIMSLAPGSVLTAGWNGEIRVRRYCAVDDILRSPAPAGSGQSSLKELLKDSVDAHLVSDVRVGLFLSSGIDSSVLCAMASKAVSHPLRTITVGFEEYRGTSNDEVPLAEQVAKRLGAEHYTRWISKDDFGGMLSDLIGNMDQPSVDGINMYIASKVAAEAGLKVAMSGVGGDELFGGYPSFSQIPRLVRRLTWAEHSRHIGRLFRMITVPMLRGLTSPKYASLLEYGGSYGGAFLLRRGLFMPWELQEFLDPALVAEGWGELGAMDALAATVRGQPNAQCSVASLELIWYLQCRLLRDADWAGMAHSLEIRTPLVDIDLLKGIAPSIRGSAPYGKSDLVSAARDDLPEVIQHRKKSGFSVPIREWLMARVDPVLEGRGLRGWAKFVGRRFGIDQRI